MTKFMNKIKNRLFSIQLPVAAFMVGKTGIPSIDKVLGYLDSYRLPILGVFPGVAILYSIVQALGWYTMTEDEQGGVKRKIRVAILIAVVIDLIVWFITDAQSKNVVG